MELANRLGFSLNEVRVSLKQVRLQFGEVRVSLEQVRISFYFYEKLCSRKQRGKSNSL
jgi:hypothetical protein